MERRVPEVIPKVPPVVLLDVHLEVYLEVLTSLDYTCGLVVLVVVGGENQIYCIAQVKVLKFMFKSLS